MGLSLNRRLWVATDKDACRTGWLYNHDKMTEPEFIE